jgi:hypothetical protein
MFCAKCGASNPDGTAFCSSCGNPLAASSSPPPPSGGPAAPVAPEFSFGAIPPGHATFRMSTAFRNAINLVKSPGTFMRQNKDDAVPVNSVIMNYVVVLAAIPFIATLIGDLVFYSFFGFGGYAFAIAITTYILDIVGVFVIGFVIWKLAPSFGTTTDQSKATLLAAFVYTPVFLISIFDIIPIISGITILGLIYGLYILYIGLPIMLGTKPDKVLTYVITIIVVAIIVFAVIGAIIGAISAAFFLRSVLL